MEKYLSDKGDFGTDGKKIDSLLVKNNNYFFYKGLSLSFEAGEKNIINPQLRKIVTKIQMDMFQNLPKPTDCTVAKDKAKN